MCRSRFIMKCHLAAVFADHSSGRLFRALLVGIFACCSGAPGMFESAVARAQEASRAVSNRPPAPAEAMRGYRLIESRIRDWGSESARVSEPAFSHVCVTLRLDGVVVSSSQAFAEDGTALETAIRDAMTEAERRLPWTHDAAGERQRREEAKRIMIAVEFGAKPEVVIAQTWEEFELMLQPGREGVAVRIGDRMKTIFPSASLRQGLNSTYSAISLANEMSEGDPLIVTDAQSAPAVIKQSRGLELMKFGVVTLAQRRPAESPVFMFRGGRVIAESEITRESLREIAAKLGANLMWRFRPLETAVNSGAEVPPGKMSVSLNFGTPSDSDAEPFETLLSVQALRRLSGTSQVDAVIRERAVLIANALFAGVAKSWPQNPDPLTSAIAVVAGTEPCGPGAADVSDVVERAKRIVESCYTESAGWSEKVPAGVRSLVVMALVRMKSPLASAALQSLYEQTPPEFLVSHLPYLVWAEQELAVDGASISARPALEEMRTEIWSHQMTGSDAGEDAPDFIGGIVFTNSANPLPTWQSLRPLSGLGAMAADPRMTDPSAYPIEIVRVARGMRFVRQLMVDEDSVYAANDPDRALFGVRSSLWEGRQPTDVQALAVMTACEAIRAIESAEK